MPEPTLDERFLEFRRSVDREIAAARHQAIAEIARVFARMRSAGSEAEWSAAVSDAEAKFAADPEALSMLAALASLTTPADAGLRAKEASAQRFAKVKIAEIQLYQAPAVKSGRSSRDLYGALRPHIDAAREAFRERYLSNGSPVADYLHSEFLRALANDDPTLLGPDYPGPLA